MGFFNYFMLKGIYKQTRCNYSRLQLKGRRFNELTVMEFNHIYKKWHLYNHDNKNLSLGWSSINNMPKLNQSQ